MQVIDKRTNCDRSNEVSYPDRNVFALKMRELGTRLSFVLEEKFSIGEGRFIGVQFNGLVSIEITSS